MMRTANRKNWKYGDWAVVAGAAEGIGEAYCKVLAGRGINLVMVDILKKETDKLADILEEEHNIRCIRLNIDLNDATSPGKIIESIKDLDCSLLIYNAAFSKVCPFRDYSEDDLNSLINVNIRTQLILIKKFAELAIKKDKKFGILTMSSLSGWFGTHLVTPYSASKAFITILSEALSYEFRNSDIDIMSCIAGATNTPGFRRSKPAKKGIPVMDPERVAKLALSRMGKKVLYIPGWKNRFNYFILRRILPRKTAVGMVNGVMRKVYNERCRDDVMA